MYLSRVLYNDAPVKSRRRNIVSNTHVFRLCEHILMDIGVSLKFNKPHDVNISSPIEEMCKCMILQQCILTNRHLLLIPHIL